jgi:hypothetical protein
MSDNIKKFVQGELERITVKISTDTGFQGTGFFITPDGYILTAWHCIKDAALFDNSSDILIEYQDGEELFAKLKPDKSIKAKDIAVLKINHQVENCIPLGRVPKNPKGDKVISVGYPGFHRNKAGIGIYSGNITRFVNNHDLEIEGAIKGQGQSGGLLYHLTTHRIIGVVKKIYGGEEKETLLLDAGLAAKIDLLFSKWDELSDIHEEIAKTWDERLVPFTSQKDGKSRVSVVQNVKKAKNVIGNVDRLTIY